MHKQNAKSSIILLEIFGFVVILLLQWGLEAIDLRPRFTDAPPTPMNWTEAACESAGVLIVAVTVIAWTYNALKRIRLLEGMLHVCCHCKRVEVDGRWIDFEKYVLDQTDTSMSHGICKTCLDQYYPDLIDAPAKPDNSLKN